MTDERARANEATQFEFRTMRDHAIEIIDLLHGVNVLAEDSAPIAACTTRANFLATEIKRKFEELAQ
jgi:hypothetical protein